MQRNNRQQEALSNTLFNLKFTQKQLTKQANKSLKESGTNEKKLSKLLNEGTGDDNEELIKILASNVIRKKNEYLNLIKLSNKLDIIISKLNTSMIMQQVNGQFMQITHNLDVALRNMNLENITMVMDKFDEQVKEIDLNTETLTSVTNNSNVDPLKFEDNDKVNELINKVKDNNNLKYPKVSLVEDSLPTEKEDVGIDADVEDKLAQRLKALRG
ncbi:related to Vacuolar protein-sorting-associated protein 46 [Hanseniaspora guilliermondii]|uniref:Related to Vacuolar protein-sorting-associated protein 46 n=1 Tax=Hanseniaspora guilliermondii TaxID=56406 RepID=A0A1L0AU14_9ASCO|nr:related to Vacuolar protein-sorting-associated protein 46 [Hanseniaspora guilliermondii]